MWEGFSILGFILLYCLVFEHFADVRKKLWHFKWLQTNDLYQIEFLELFDHLTLCKQINDV